MKINIEFLGFPMVSDVIGKKKLELTAAPGGTIKGIIDELIERYGKKIREAFYDSEGKFDPMIQIVLNGKSFIPPEKHEAPLLNEGDTLTFMLLLAGG